MFSRTRLLSGWVLCLLLPVGCSQLQEAPNAHKKVAAVSRAAHQIEQTLARTERLQRKRHVLGDTLSLPYRELQKYLPATVAGFVRDGNPQGESVNMGGVSYSTCEQHYRKGNQRLKVQLVDYNGATALYAGVTAMMSANFSQENDEQLMRGCNLGLPNVQGYETLQKKERLASVALGVGDRFFVSVELNQQQDTDAVRNVARAMDLQALAKL
ncbi:hypothetical protein F0P96_19645 [Hymenobacter busanensis]|uniref:Uncharacterized protein n=1 Tax=Hymenobacter busanensis TaxID=2607656 RepID=A0A7L5A053_9BACT|nr:hypothetical protein [Hymenobacter busanensis]KAA9325547.1 hypothetical protein F0P96_19645 [Hymenobacter busanensis]QHJ07782.1 hypothetical protein GUY19_11020 [Hymenobacter busanensis]